MQLIIKNGKVIATHEDYQKIAHLYPNTECILWSKPIPPPDFNLDDPFPDDPRSEEDKKEYYLDKRRVAYPPIEDQLDMLYHDTLNNTTTWTDAITVIKEQYSKPSLEVL